MGINEICRSVNVSLTPLPPLAEGQSIPDEIRVTQQEIEILGEISWAITSFQQLMTIGQEVSELDASLSPQGRQVMIRARRELADQFNLRESMVSGEAVYNRAVELMRARNYPNREGDLWLVSSALRSVAQVYRQIREVLSSNQYPNIARIYSRELATLPNFEQYSLAIFYRRLFEELDSVLHGLSPDRADEIGLNQIDLVAQREEIVRNVSGVLRSVTRILSRSCVNYNQQVAIFLQPIDPTFIPLVPPGEQTVVPEVVPPTPPPPPPRTADDFVDYFLEGGVAAVFDFSQAAGWESWGALVADFLINLNIWEHHGFGLYFSTGGTRVDVNNEWSPRDSDIFGGVNYFYHNRSSRLQVDAAVFSPRYISVDDDGYYLGEERLTLGQLAVGGSFLDGRIGAAGSFMFGNELGFSLRLSSLWRLGENSRHEDWVVLAFNGDLVYMSGEPENSGQIAGGIRVMPRIYQPLRAFIDLNWSYDFVRDESQGRLTFGLAVGDISGPNTAVLGLER